MVRAIACAVLSVVVTVAQPAQTFDRAVDALRAGDFATAEQGFQQVLAAAPDHIGALQNLGLVYSRTGRLDLAVSTFRRALTIRPDDKALLLNLGIAYVKQNSFTDALPVFQQIVASVPAARDGDLLYSLAAGYLRQQPSAEPALNSFLAKVPPAPAAYVRCKLDEEAGLHEEAIAACRKTLSIIHDFPGAHRELGRALTGRHSPEAESELRAALRQDSKDSIAAYYLGLAILQDGRPTDAMSPLENAVHLDPSFWGSYYYLGKTKLQLRQPAEAEPLLRKAAELNPGASAVAYELGRALMANGHADEAEQFMQRVRDLRARELSQDAQTLHKK